MFSNIVEVYAANYQFWMDHLLPMLNNARDTRQSLNPLLMKEGFLKVLYHFIIRLLLSLVCYYY